MAHAIPEQSGGGFGGGDVRAARPPRGTTRGHWYCRPTRRGTACLPLDLLSGLFDLVLPTGPLRLLGVAPWCLRRATERAELRLFNFHAPHLMQKGTRPSARGGIESFVAVDAPG